MRSRRLAVVIAAMGITIGATERAEAQSNYRLAPVGGRSTLLGGTGIVYGRDAAAAFLNPATAVLADDNRLSFAVNVYTMSFVYAPRWYEPGPIDRRHFGTLQLDGQSMTDLEFNALPSSLCIFFRVGDVKFLVGKTSADVREREARLGFCAGTISSQSFNFAAEGFNVQNAGGVSRQAQTLSQSYDRFAAGPTYAMNISDSLAIGASLHGTFASHRSLLASSATTYGTTPQPISSMFYTGSRGDSFQFEALIGATLAFGRQKVGLSIKSPSLHVYGVGGANRQSHYEGAGNATETVSAQGSFVSNSPMRISLGTGVEGKWGLFEFNTSLVLPTGASYEADLEGRSVKLQGSNVDDRELALVLSEPARGVVNLAAGAEVFVSKRLSVLSGLSTDFSAVSNGALNGSLFNYYPYRTHRVNASLGIASSGSGGELLFGTEFSAGWGERLSVNSYQLPPEIGTTGHGTYQLLFVIAGSTSLLAISRAVTDVKNVLTEPAKTQKPEPKQEPAKPNPPRVDPQPKKK